MERKRTTFGFPEGFTLLQRHLCHFFFFTALTEALRQKQKKRKAKEVSFPKSRSRGWTPHHVRRRLQSAQKPGVGAAVAGWGMLNCDTTLSSGCQLWTVGLLAGDVSRANMWRGKYPSIDTQEGQPYRTRTSRGELRLVLFVLPSPPL